MRIPEFRSCLVLLVAASPLAAQSLFSYRPTGGGSVFHEHPCLSPAWTSGTGATPAGPGVVLADLPAPARPFAGHPLGACTVDTHNGILFTTNGLGSIQRSEYPRIGSASGAVIPSLPIPTAVGSVTGMAFDPTTRHLFLTNGTRVFEVDPAAGMAIVCWWSASPINILVGLEFDPDDPSHLLGVSSAGEIAVYDRCLGLLGYSAATYPWPGVDATAIALDMSDAAGGMVYVLYRNGEVYNHTLGVLHTAGIPGHVGMVYLPSPVQLPSPGCGSIAPESGVSTLVIENNPGFGLEVDHLPAGTSAVLWVLEVTIPPASPAIPAAIPGMAVGCGATLWPALGSATVFTLTGGATSAVQPLAIPLGLKGFGLIAQPAMLCPASPCGFALGNGMQLEISRM